MILNTESESKFIEMKLENFLTSIFVVLYIFGVGLTGAETHIICAWWRDTADFLDGKPWCYSLMVPGCLPLHL